MERERSEEMIGGRCDADWEGWSLGVVPWTGEKGSLLVELTDVSQLICHTSKLGSAIKIRSAKIGSK